MLISAAIALGFIHEVEDFINSNINNAEYKDADSYKAAAGWLVFVASIALPYHIIMLIFCSLYLGSCVKRVIEHME